MWTVVGTLVDPCVSYVSYLHGGDNHELPAENRVVVHMSARLVGSRCRDDSFVGVTSDWQLRNLVCRRLWLAIEARVPLRAVFVRGECATFSMVEAPWLQTRVHWAWKTNVPLAFPAFFGWYGTWLPKRVPLTLVTEPVRANNKAQYYNELNRIASI